MPVRPHYSTAGGLGFLATALRRAGLLDFASSVGALDGANHVSNSWKGLIRIQVLYIPGTEFAFRNTRPSLEKLCYSVRIRNESLHSPSSRFSNLLYEYICRSANVEFRRDQHRSTIVLRTAILFHITMNTSFWVSFWIVSANIERLKSTRFPPPPVPRLPLAKTAKKMSERDRVIVERRSRRKTPSPRSCGRHLSCSSLRCQHNPRFANGSIGFC